MASEHLRTPSQNGTDSAAPDFTVARYAQLLELAKANYRGIRYGEIDFGCPFLLWRHDCDVSLQRALRLAELEHRHGVVATYFLLPHCRHYNLLEKTSARIVGRIAELGHDLGLHFDAAFYDLVSEDRLDSLVYEEAQWLRRWFGVEPAAFSFHDPDAFCLSCEKERYGGLLNCYSRLFKDRVAYCSDSNGYWRHRPLYDVLAGARECHLQVLTHPEHWQEQPLHPRERVFRSIYGRARNALEHYDAALERGGRNNLAGPSCALHFLRARDPGRHRLLDFLWNSGAIAPLFAELCRLHEQQLLRLCIARFCGDWRAPAGEVNAFLESNSYLDDAPGLFAAAFGEDGAVAVVEADAAAPDWRAIRARVLHCRPSVEAADLEDACTRLAGRIERLAQWGVRCAPAGYDGLGPLGEISIRTEDAGADVVRLVGTPSFADAHPAWRAFLVRVGGREARG